jgi:hypothetical protein
LTHAFKSFILRLFGYGPDAKFIQVFLNITFAAAQNSVSSLSVAHCEPAAPGRRRGGPRGRFDAFASAQRDAF